MRVILHNATVAMTLKIGLSCYKFDSIFRHINASDVELAATLRGTLNLAKLFFFNSFPVYYKHISRT